MKTKTKKSVNPITRFDQLIDTIKNQIFDYPNIHEIDIPAYQILWVLRTLKEKFSVQWTTALDISDILVESLGVSVTEKSVQNTLAPLKGKKIHKKEELGITVYNIMEKGLKYLDDLEGKSIVHVIGGKNPRKDKLFLADVIKSSKSSIKIVDTFFGSNSLLNIEKFSSGKSIQLLTTKVQLERNQSMRSFLTELSDFKKIHKNFEARLFPNRSELHDRYIMTKNSLILVGHGIKDLGNKESFIITFDKKMSSNVLVDLNLKFDQRWKNSNPI